MILIFVADYGFGYLFYLGPSGYLKMKDAPGKRRLNILLTRIYELQVKSQTEAMGSLER